MRTMLRIIVATVALAVTPVMAQTVNWATNVTAGGRAATLGDGKFVTRMMAVDSGGNVVVAGTTHDGASKNWVVTKLAANGGLVLWQKTFNGPAAKDDEAMAVALDASGNALVVGTVKDANGNSDVKVIKFQASDGAILWQATYDGGTADVPYAVAVDSTAHVIVGAESVNAAGDNDIVVLKFNGATGAPIWKQVINGGQNDFFSDMALDLYNNVMGAGVKMNAAGSSDIVAFKIVGGSGALAWSTVFDGGGNDEAFGVSADPAANSIVTGYAISGGKKVAKVLKYSGVDGSLLWQATISGAGDQVGEAVATDSSGNVLVAVTATSGTGTAIRTLKYSPAGAVAWDKTFDGGTADNPHQLVVDPAGNAIVVGSSLGATSYDWIALNLAAGDGAARYTYRYNGGSSGADSNFGVIATSGGVYLGGTSSENAGLTMRVVRLQPGIGTKKGKLYDFDGNGSSDLVWQHPDGRVMLSPIASSAPGTAATLLAAGTGWSVKAVGDFDGDGKADILFQHTDGSAALWLMNGAVQTGGGRILAAGTGWTAIAVGDVDGDGKDDILWQHTDGSAAVWLMNGAVQSGGGRILGAATGWKAKALGDIDGDGKADILWEHTDGRTSVWTMDGMTQTGGGVILAAGQGWSAFRIVDLDGDGKGDVLWQHADGRVAAWTMNGLTQKGGAVLIAGGTGWSLKSAGDYNADGKVDLAWQHTDGRVGLWMMNGLSQAGGVGVTPPATGFQIK